MLNDNTSLAPHGGTPYTESLEIYKNHRDWIEALAPKNTVNATAKAIGTDASTLTRRLAKHDGQLTADQIIRISLAYSVDPLLALVQTGKVPPEYMDAKPPTAEEKKQLLREMFEALDNQ